MIAAADFFTAEVWTARGLVTHYVLFVIDHASRAVHIAGINPNPDAAFVAQVAHNLTDPIDGFLRQKRLLIVDRDAKFTSQFAHILADAGVRVVRTAFQAPDMNAIAERWVASVRHERLDRMILFGERRLQTGAPRVRCSLQRRFILPHEVRLLWGIGLADPELVIDPVGSSGSTPACRSVGRFPGGVYATVTVMGGRPS